MNGFEHTRPGEATWVNTAPMIWAEEGHPAREMAPCPWGQVMLGTPAIIELIDGRVLRAGLLGWDAVARLCRYQSAAGEDEQLLPLGRIRMLSLARSRPLPPGTDFGGLGDAPRADVRIPYHLVLTDGTALQGVTLGRVQRPEGHYLARRVGRDGCTVRMFVPHSAVAEVRFVEPAGAMVSAATPMPKQTTLPRIEPVVRPEDWKAALARRADPPPHRLGDMLLALGLVTADQIDDALASCEGEAAAMRLGERLVRSGAVPSPDMQRALHLMRGHPAVDLARYPVDPATRHRLPYDLARELEVLPVAVVDGRLVVAMADPGRLKVLQQLEFVFDGPVVPALSWREAVADALPRIYRRRTLAA